MLTCCYTYIYPIYRCLCSEITLFKKQKFIILCYREDNWGDKPRQNLLFRRPIAQGQARTMKCLLMRFCPVQSAIARKVGAEFDNSLSMIPQMHFGNQLFTCVIYPCLESFLDQKLRKPLFTYLLLQKSTIVTSCSVYLTFSYKGLSRF